jgi:ribonuclease HII
MSTIKPTFHEEKICWQQGFNLIAGIDEAGRGPLAGPVVAAAVILPKNMKKSWFKLVADSKLVTEIRREYLFECITGVAVSYGVGVIDAATIDMVGIAKATRLAMKSAVKQLEPAPDYLLIDFFRLPEVRIKQTGVLDGDSVCFSIACASIIAKVTRDRLMCQLDKEYPGYFFNEHKGYSTKKHQECLRRLGPSPIHRITFQPVRDQAVEQEE